MSDKIMKLIEKAIMVGIIQSTMEYEVFKLHKGNRKIRREQVRALKKSISYKDILNPIIVNEKMEIIEGQHRFTARKELNLPIIFFIVEGLGAEDMQILNDGKSKSGWEHEDFLDMYVEEGKLDYITFKKLYEKYKINYSDLLHIIRQFLENEPKQDELSNSFDKGELKIENYEYIVDFLEELELFSKYDYSKDTSFVRAFFKLYEEDFYDKEYIRKRIDIKQFVLQQGKRHTINDYGLYLADNLYTDRKRGVEITYNIYGQYFEKASRDRGRKPIKNKLKKIKKEAS